MGGGGPRSVFCGAIIGGGGPSSLVVGDAKLAVGGPKDPGGPKLIEAGVIIGGGGPISGTEGPKLGLEIGAIGAEILDGGPRGASDTVAVTICGGLDGGPEGPRGPKGLEVPEGGIKGTVPGGTKVEAGGCTVEGCVRGWDFETTGTEGPAIGAPIGMGGGLKIAVGVLSTMRIIGELGINLDTGNFTQVQSEKLFT